MARNVARFFHPVMAAKDLGRGPVRVELDGRGYALFRDAAGAPAALVDRCPHRFSPLSAGRVRPDGRLACGYHGWHFDSAGAGQSPSQPELRNCDVKAMQVVERHGYLWLAERDAAARVPEMTWEGFDHIGTFSEVFDAPLHVAFDNFSEDEHTPWVHHRLGWDERDIGTVKFEATNHDDRTEVHYEARQRWRLALWSAGVRSGDIFHNRWVTRFDPVCTTYTISWTSADGATERPVTIKVPIYINPITEATTRFVVFVFARIESVGLRLLAPLLRPFAVYLTRQEILDDQRWVPTIADTPRSLEGMRLGKFDKPLIHNHRLLDSIYLAED